MSEDIDKDIRKIRWTVKDPYLHDVVLRQDTYESHINSDHTDKDAMYRASLESVAKMAIEKPLYILRDKNFNDRHHYVDVFPAMKNGKPLLRFLKTIVDVSCEPHEVITWMPERKSVSAEGGILYDSHKGIVDK